jgi:hypothetical protein
MTTQTAILKRELSTLEDCISSIKKELMIAEAAALNFDLAILGDRLTTMTDPLMRHGWSIIAYIGFSTKKDANSMVKRFTKSAYECKKTGKPSPFLFMELRESERVFEGKYELKIIDLHQVLINKLCGEFGYAIRNNCTQSDIPDPQEPLSNQETEDLADLVAISQTATIN